MSETGKQAQVVARRMHITPLALLAAVVSFSVFLLIARPYVASAATAPDSCFLFNSTLGAITGYSTDPTCPKDLDIPAIINGVNVISIDGSAFYGKQLTSVTVPDSVSMIGDYAFYNNPLESVSIPEGVPYIGRYTFSHPDVTQGIAPNPMSLDIPYGNPSILSDYQRHEMTIAGTPAALTLNQTQGDASMARLLSTQPAIFTPMINGKRELGLVHTSIQVDVGAKVLAMLEVEPGKLQSLSFFATDAENTSMVVYGEDAAGNRMVVDPWAVSTQEVYTNIAPASNPNPYTKTPTEIQIARSVSSQDEDMVLVAIDAASLKNLSKVYVEFSGDTTGDFVQWGFFGQAYPPVDEDDSTEDTGGDSADVPQAPDSGVGAANYATPIISIVVLLSAIALVRRTQ
jgi:hypothetical protein